MVSLPSPSDCTVGEPSTSLMVLLQHYCQEPFGVSMRGHCVPRVGRSVTEARGQGSVVVVSAEQEASAATRLQYASYTSTCQFILWTDSTKTP